MAGPRGAQALRARLASICHCLEKDEQAEPAIHGADQPSLWDKVAFAEALASWMHGRGSVDRIGLEIAEKIESQIAAEPVRRPRPVRRKLVEELVRRKLAKCAALLDPDLPGVVALEDLLESAVAALADGEHDHPCWQRLAELIANDTTGKHLLVSLAEQVRRETGERRTALERNGWRTFEAAAQKEPSLRFIRTDQTVGLPVFDLAASLSLPGGLGNAALGVIFSANSNQKGKSEWWDALLHEFFRWRRYSAFDCPEDRRDVAMALVVRLLGDLKSEERQVFWSALGRIAGNKSEWQLLVGAQ
jgi:hypothetical protein